MNTHTYISYISLALIVAISVLVLATQSSAQEQAQAEAATTSAEMSAQMNVDAGNALNAQSETRATGTENSVESEMQARIREGGQTIDAGTIPERQQQSVQSTGPGDVDGDGYGDVTSVDPDFLDVDSDDDGIRDGIGASSESEIEIVEYRDGDAPTRKSAALDKASPKLIEALSMDASTPLLYQGVRASVTADACDTARGNDCDDSNTEAGPPSASFHINVVGATVRGWDSKQKQEVQTRAAAISTVETPNDFGLWLVSKVLADDTIAEADIRSDAVIVKYETNARLFGLIPITVPVTASIGGRMKVSDVTLERTNAPDVEIEYPWYGFLLGKKAVSAEIIADTEAIAANYHASQTAEAKFKAGKALAETVK